MNRKQLLRFYFSAEVLEAAFDNIILKYALSSADCGKCAQYYAHGIIRIIQTKDNLSKLWNYLDSVMKDLTAEERRILCFYGKRRKGTSRLSEDCKKAIKRAAVKFTRHARSVDRFEEGVRLVKEYYCLM